MIGFSEGSDIQLLRNITGRTGYGMLEAVELASVQNVDTNTCVISWKFKQLYDDQGIAFTVSTFFLSSLDFII